MPSLRCAGPAISGSEYRAHCTLCTYASRRPRWLRFGTATPQHAERRTLDQRAWHASPTCAQRRARKLFQDSEHAHAVE
jgi:hypothetical protein